MATVTASVNFYYSQDFQVEVDDVNDTDTIMELVDELASNMEVWDGNNAYTVEFQNYEIEIYE
jgi:hypothetical protein